MGLVKRRELQTPFEKGNPTETSETQNQRDYRSFTPEIQVGWAAKGEEAFKAFKGGPNTAPEHLFTPIDQQ